MKIYRFLSNIKFLKGYSVKLLFIAVLGIHIPLIGLAIFLTSQLASDISVQDIFLLTFGLTFLASAVSLLILNEMITPVRKAKNALQSYLEEGILPDLPMHYHDEVGVLMQSVQKTLESLDELIQEKQDMIALLSHDLRSPINSATSLANLIKMESDDRIIQDYCDKIGKQNEKQLQLINTVLSMLQQNHLHIDDAKKKPELLIDLVKIAEENLEVDLKQKEIQLVKEVPATLQVRVQPDIFIQVLINVIHNAIKFSKRQNQITIRAYQEMDEVITEIQDYGLGFDSVEDQKKAFVRFTPLKRAGTEGEISTGIGLYLCKKIIQRHGGKINVNSAGRNKGATFYINIPV